MKSLIDILTGHGLAATGLRYLDYINLRISRSCRDHTHCGEHRATVVALSVRYLVSEPRQQGEEITSLSKNVCQRTTSVFDILMIGGQPALCFSHARPSKGPHTSVCE